MHALSQIAMCMTIFEIFLTTSGRGYAEYDELCFSGQAHELDKPANNESLTLTQGLSLPGGDDICTNVHTGTMTIFFLQTKLLEHKLSSTKRPLLTIICSYFKILAFTKAWSVVALLSSMCNQDIFVYSCGHSIETPDIDRCDRATENNLPRCQELQERPH
jgi:hypothetical protein